MVQLNDDLIKFFSNLEIKFEWKNKFYIDVMEYFPLLKRGVMTNETCYKIFLVYGRINNFIDDLIDIENRSTRMDMIIKIINKIKPFTSSKICKILFETCCEPSPKLNEIDNNSELDKEIILSGSLLRIVSQTDRNYLIRLIDEYSHKSIYNKLNKILNEYNSGYKNLIGLLDKPSPAYSQPNRIFDEAFRNPSIRLLCNVLNNDNEDMVIALYIDEIDFYAGYNDLYILAISCKHINIEIANMIKEKIIIQNLLIKQVLTINFEDLIGPSDIPNIICNIII